MSPAQGAPGPSFPEAEPAQAGDLDALLALEQAGAEHPWSRAHFSAALARADHEVLVLRQAPGTCALSAFCVTAWVGDELEVHNLVVHPEARRQGLGRRLLEAALARGRARGARRAYLEVRVSNAAARALYEALGFGEQGVRRGYYSQPPEDALRLSRNLEFQRAAC